MAKYLWVALGCVCLALGTVGVVLPILPTVPFYLATVFCFAKGSQRLHDWFISTKLYEKNLKSFAERRGMTLATKLKIVGTVTVVMGIAFYFMRGTTVGRIVLAVVWVAHVLYFALRVKTIPPEHAN